MQNWEVLQKKISEMDKDEFIRFMHDKLSLQEIRNIIGNEFWDCARKDCRGITCKECKKNILNGEYQPPKQEKWIVHRTLRKSNKETYLVDYFCENDEVIYVSGIAHYFSYDKNKAYKFEDKNVAIQVRNKLNTLRVGKQYLWVISKVEE